MKTPLDISQLRPKLQRAKPHLDKQEWGQNPIWKYNFISILSRDFFPQENNLSQKPWCLRPSLFLRCPLSYNFYCKYYCLCML